MFLLQRNSQSSLPRATWGWKSRLKLGKKKGGDIEFNPCLETPAAGELETPKFCFFPPFFTSPKRCDFWGFFRGQGGISTKRGAPSTSTTPPKNQGSSTPPAQPNPKKSPNRLPSSKKRENFKKLNECRSRHGEEGEGGNFSF